MSSMKWMEHRRCVVVVAGCMLAMVGCGSSGSTTSTTELLTPDQAKAVALVHLQKPTTSAALKDEGGSLRAIDQAQQLVNPPPSPEPTANPATTHNVVVWVPHQTSYPLTFLCFDSPTIPNQRALPLLFRFDKPNKSSPWTVTYELLVSSMGAAPDVAVDSNGYSQVIPTGRYGALLASPANLAKDYAAYLQAGNSADTHEFAPGPVTSSIVDSDNKTLRTAQQQQGYTLTETFTPTGDATAAYLLNDGGALVLFGMRVTAHVVAPNGVITIAKDGKGIVGPAAGKYHDTTTDTVLLVAVIDPPSGSADKVSGVGAFSGPVRSTGTPA